MNKVVTTVMTEKYLGITVTSSIDTSVNCVIELPFALFSPQTALQIAMAIVSDATVPHEKTENK